MHKNGIQKKLVGEKNVQIHFLTLSGGTTNGFKFQAHFPLQRVFVSIHCNVQLSAVALDRARLDVAVKLG